MIYEIKFVQLMVDGRHGNHIPPVAPPVGLVPKRLPGNVTALLQKMAGNLVRETRQIHGHVQIYRHVKVRYYLNNIKNCQDSCLAYNISFSTYLYSKFAATILTTLSTGKPGATTPPSKYERQLSTKDNSKSLIRCVF